MDHSTEEGLHESGSLSVSAVVFDAPGVLFDDSMWHRWLFRLLLKVGLQTDYQIFFRVWDEQFQPQIATGQLEYWDALRQYLREVGLRPACIDEVLIAGRSRKDSLQQPTCPFSGVPQTIMELFGRAFPLAAIEDREQGEPLQRLLSKWGLARYFTHVGDSAQGKLFDGDSSVMQLGSAEQLLLVSNRNWLLQTAADAGVKTIGFATQYAAERRLTDIRHLSAALRHVTTRRAAG